MNKKNDKFLLCNVLPENFTHLSFSFRISQSCAVVSTDIFCFGGNTNNSEYTTREAFRLATVST